MVVLVGVFTTALSSEGVQKILFGIYCSAKKMHYLLIEMC